MNVSDKNKFKEELNAIYELYGKDKPTMPVLRQWWMALERYPVDVVIKAFDYIVQHNKFAPKPADVVDLVLSYDGRPTGDEAWSMALQSSDEGITVVWAEDVAQALGMGAGLILATGDVTAARMAFRDSYERTVQRARDNGVPVKYIVSQGHDVAGRVDAIEQAEAKGLISHDTATALIPQSTTSQGAKLLAITSSAIAAKSDDEKSVAKKHIEELRKIIG